MLQYVALAYGIGIILSVGMVVVGVALLLLDWIKAIKEDRKSQR